MNTLKAGHRFTLQVDRLSLGGDAIGRVDAAVVFVPYGCPGDTLEVELTEVRKNYARARILRVLEASPVRTNPPCPYHFHAPTTSSSASVSGGSTLKRHVDPPLTTAGDDRQTALPCGGCSWQQMKYEFQLDAKRQLVQEALERIGGVHDLDVLDTMGMDDPWRYRNKVQQPVGWDGKRVISGFYAPGSHDIVPIEDCLVQPELSVRILNRARALIDQFQLRVYDAERHSGWLRHFWIRTTSTGQALLVIVTKDEAFPHQADFVNTLRREFPALVGIHQNVNPGRTNVILGRLWRSCWGAETIDEELGPLRFRLTPGSFFQVNTPQTVILYNAVKAAAPGGSVLIDLYCGVGGIALWLAAGYEQVIGVDEVRNAIIDAANNAALNGIRNTRFLASPAEAFIAKYRASGASNKETTVVLDPPRAGCDPRVLGALARLQPASLIYVSCDPGTLARDLAILQRGGFRVESAQPVDLFPQTPHIETVVRLAHLSR
jgi:23S rRNA (uracil1939-C5)-methyltransferase